MSYDQCSLCHTTAASLVHVVNRMYEINGHMCCFVFNPTTW